MTEVLFVCTGNICRSAMAEALARHEARERRLEGVAFSSAGVSAVAGMPASDGSRKAMEAVGLDLSAHRARPLDRTICQGADLILAMTGQHLDAIRKGCPLAAEKAHTIHRYVNGNGRDVEDPYGGGAETYRQCLEEIRTLVDGLLDRLEEEAV